MPWWWKSSRDRRIESLLYAVMREVHLLQIYGRKNMADLTRLKAAVAEVKKDLAEAVRRLKDLPTVEDPKVQAEIDAIAADLEASDVKFEEMEEAAAAPSVTGDKLETHYPTDEEQIDPVDKQG